MAIIWHKSQHILTHTEVLELNRIVKMICGYDASVKQKDKDQDEKKSTEPSKGQINRNGTLKET